VLGDVAAADDLAGAAGQVLEQRIFLGPQENFLVANEHATASGLDHQRAKDQAVGQYRLMPAANERTKARHQLAEVVRLDEVVVGAGVEPFDARFHSVARGQHENRHRASGVADRPADGQAVDEREHDVEDDAVVVGGGGLEDGRFAVFGHVDRVGVLAQPLCQHVRRVWLVFDQKDSHFRFSGHDSLVRSSAHVVLPRARHARRRADVIVRS
jgi:hypothetical protein